MTEIQVDIRGRMGAFELEAAFTPPSNGVTAIFGPSGCGKTSILRAIAGLTPEIKGTVNIRGQIWQDDSVYLPPHKRAVGYVFQESSLFPHLNVTDNVTYGMKRSRLRSAGPDFSKLCDILGISHLLKRATRDLSGGEKQRISIARALLSDPELLLMDEPLSALDQENKNEILPYLEKLASHFNLPIFYVSHDLREVERLADHLILIERGKIKAEGSVQSMITNPDLPFQRRPDVAAILAGEISSYDAQFDLTTFLVGQTPLIVPGRIGKIGDVRKLRIAASDVGLSLSPLKETVSYLNSPSVKIQKIQPTDSARVVIQMEIGDTASGYSLLSAITRKSAEQLSLSPGQTVTALIKSISFIDG